jgi:hypothetical protein
MAESIHADRRRRRAEYYGLATGEDKKPSASMTKAELLEVAAAAGLEVDESITKKELLEALEE